MVSLPLPTWTCQSEAHASLSSLLHLTKSRVHKKVSQQEKETKRQWRDGKIQEHYFINTSTSLNKLFKARSSVTPAYNISCEYHKLKQKERMNKEASNLSRVH